MSGYSSGGGWTTEGEKEGWLLEGQIIHSLGGEDRLLPVGTDMALGVHAAGERKRVYDTAYIITSVLIT